MRQRYEVFCNGKWFASVHATTAEEAIKQACRVTGHPPAGCRAELPATASRDVVGELPVTAGASLC